MIINSDIDVPNQQNNLNYLFNFDDAINHPFNEDRVLAQLQAMPLLGNPLPPVAMEPHPVPERRKRRRPRRYQN